MKKLTLLMPMLIIATATLGLSACNKSPADAEADAVRKDSKITAEAVDQRADSIEQGGKADASATKEAAANVADALHDNADAIKKNGEKRADAIEDGKVPPAPVTPKP